MNKFSFKSALILFYILISIYADIEKISQSFFTIKFEYVIFILSIIFFSMFLRSILQSILLKKIGIQLSSKENFKLFLAGLVMIITPGGSGQIIKSIFLKKQYDFPISKTIPLIFYERFYDLIAITSIITITVFVIFRFESLIASLIGIIFCLFLTVISTKQIFLKKMLILLEKIRFSKSLEIDFDTMSASIKSLNEKNLIFKSALFYFLITLLEGYAIYLGFLALGIDFGFLKTIQFFYTSIIFGAVSFLPGGVGVVEGSLVTMLSNNLELSTSTAIVMFVRLTTIWFATLVGFISFLLLFLKLK